MAERTQADGRASIYYTDENYTNIYVKLPNYEQLIFYWSDKLNKQKRLPKFRISKETCEWAYIKDFNDESLTVVVEDVKYTFNITKSYIKQYIVKGLVVYEIDNPGYAEMDGLDVDDWLGTQPPKLKAKDFHTRGTN